MFFNQSRFWTLYMPRDHGYLRWYTGVYYYTIMVLTIPLNMMAYRGHVKRYWSI